MPLLGAANTPTSLSQGDAVAILNGENLANGKTTMAVGVISQPFAVCLSVHNATSQTVALVSCPTSASSQAEADYLPVYTDDGVAISVGAGHSIVANIAPGMLYAVRAAGDIVDGTIWVSR